MREDKHLVPVVREVRRKKDVPETADVREKALGPDDIRLDGLFKKLDKRDGDGEGGGGREKEREGGGGIEKEREGGGGREKEREGWREREREKEREGWREREREKEMESEGFSMFYF